MGGAVSLYEILKARKTGLSPDLYTLLRARREMSERVITAEPPIHFKSDSTAISEYQISGDTVQNGTPAPDNPIDVLGVGDKTANLYDINTHNTMNGYINSAYLTSDGSVETWGSSEITEYISISADTTYTLSGLGGHNALCYAFYNASKEFISAHPYSGALKVTFTTTSEVAFMRFSHGKTSYRTMLNIGSTALPYEPYGYKIPITLNSVTQNVYIDSPLYEGDYIKRNADGTGVLHQDGADTPITLPQLSAVEGNNELNISTTVTPEVTLKGKIKQLPDSNMNALLSVMEEM